MSEVVKCPRCGGDGVDEIYACICGWRERAEDSAGIQTFPTGARRGTDADGARYDRIPQVGLRRLAETCAEGASKYGVGHGVRGFPSSNLLNHVLTHLNRFLDGDRSEDHLAHAAWGIFVAMHNQERRPDMDDIETLRQDRREPIDDATHTGPPEGSLEPPARIPEADIAAVADTVGGSSDPGAASDAASPRLFTAGAVSRGDRRVPPSSPAPPPAEPRRDPDLSPAPDSPRAINVAVAARDLTEPLCGG